MTETLDRISAHNLWAAGTLEDDNPWVRDAVTDLALDPVNLAEYPAVTDLHFVGTMYSMVLLPRQKEAPLGERTERG